MKNTQIGDERIGKESSKMFLYLFPLALVIDIACLIVKLVCGQPFIMYALEIILFVVAIAVYVLDEMRYGILFVKKKDFCLKEMQAKACTWAFASIFAVDEVGTLTMFFVLKENNLWIWLSTLTWFIPAFVSLFYGIKNGLFIYGTEKKKKEYKKRFNGSVLIASLIFGSFMWLATCVIIRKFDPMTLFIIPVAGAAWGILFSVFMSLIMKKSEKNADREVSEVEHGSEE